ncbi:hypothetical protein ACFQ40_00075 [Kroppenstedtia eburnea]|uniref:hypothetical protein n=1 Tax=Kroppenstedtia eburnea TaxID=714067 RepID=UPI003632B0BE
MERVDIKALQGPITVDLSRFNRLVDEEDTVQVQPAEPGYVAVIACTNSTQDGFQKIYVSPIRFWIIVEKRYQGKIMELQITALDDEYRLLNEEPDLIDFAPMDEVLESKIWYERKAREILETYR